MDNPGTPETPAPTHWNTRRDPIKSFQCPYCKTRIRIRIDDAHWFEEIFCSAKWSIACCDVCNITLLADDWRYYKELELLQE